MGRVSLLRLGFPSLQKLFEVGVDPLQGRAAEMTVTVSLDDFTGECFIRGLVTPSKAKGVYAHNMPAIEDVSIGLWSVTHENSFAAVVRWWQNLGKMIPIGQCLILLMNRFIWVISSVNKDRFIGFVVGLK